MPQWTIRDIPDQTGRRAVITGATGGLGYETALALAGAGAEVIVTGRNDAKGAAALRGIQQQHPAAKLRYATLDLNSLASVAAFATRMAAEGAALDLLVNNAGIMALPARRTTADGFEAQIGVNYLGHFALTGRLLPLLRRGQRPRVVSLASLVHQRGSIALGDLQSERAYSPWRAYAQSKLAMLMFAFELQRRSDAHGWGLLSDAAHPGWARTELFANGAGAGGGGLQTLVFNAAAPLFGQSAAAGALPTLYAATAPQAKPGGYYGPLGFFEMKGPPGVAKVAPQARDAKVAARLWEMSAKLTGVDDA